MPGPGPHLMYAMSSSIAMSHLTGGRFSPHHTLTYTINSFFGPDIGSFIEWLCSTFLDGASYIISSLADAIHHPFYYILILGFPSCFLYSWLSASLVGTGLLDSGYGVPLSKMQSFFLVAAGSLSHFFLDHLFEEDGRTSMYTWIMSTGWWEGRAPVNPDAVLVVGFLCTCLIGGFIYINSSRLRKRITRKHSFESMELVVIITSLYYLWCASQIYWVNPRRAPVGEEADLGVLVFLATYFLLPHWLCILSMKPLHLHRKPIVFLQKTHNYSVYSF